MADKSIKHFIFMRFFSFDDPKYPYNIYDVDFLSKQLVVAQNNALSSLENQTNKNFNLVFVVNTKFFDNPKYDFVFSTLRDSTTLPITFIKNSDMRSLVKKALNEYDFVIQSRMDFDDFIFKDAIADTHSKINECDNILAYGYCRGYSYLYEELYVHYSLWIYKNLSDEPLGHHSILQSLILKSSFAKNLPSIGIYGSNHGQIKLRIKDFLEKNGIEFSERMFRQNTLTNAYIYFRSEYSHVHLTRNGGNPTFKVPNKPPLTTNDITKKQLEEEFGFFRELKSIK